MELRFHKRIQADLNEILGKYYHISHQLGEDFFAEFQVEVSRVVENPRRQLVRLQDFDARELENRHN